MLEMQTEVNVQGISGKDVFDFMLTCSDEDYQKWWPGVHFAFHIIKHQPNSLGNLVYFDEYIGKYRFSSQAILEEIVPSRKLVWHMKKFIMLPGWLTLNLMDTISGVKITHTLTVGFHKLGRVLDPFLKIFLSRKFENALAEHAKIEFNKLTGLLSPSQD